MKYQITYTLTCVTTFETDAEEDTDEFYDAQNDVMNPGIDALIAKGNEVIDSDVISVETVEE